MCLFCAAVPATIALGAAAAANQRQIKRALHAGQAIKPIPAWMLALPAEKFTAAIVVGLVVGSAVYHTQVSAL
ncbi:MAG: hypothetical protein ACOYL5_03150 [Phototrophicaceae bacterium]|jgi:hypothetical protein